MDPEQIYQEVLQEEQQKGSPTPIAEGRAKAARVRAEHGSPHPKEPKWWPGSQPHLEGDGAAPAEAEAAEEPAEADAAEEPAEAPAPEPEPEPAPEPAAPAEQPAAAAAAEQPAPAEQPAAQAAPPAAAQAPAAPATPSELPPEQRPAGVTHGVSTGTRLRPEDEVTTEAQFEGQRAVFERRKLIDELVGSGVPAVSAEEAGRPRGGAMLLLYVLIPVLAILFLVAQDNESEQSAGETATESEAGGGEGAEGGLTVSASNVTFDTDTIELPAGEETPLHFVNEDSVQHNISILEDQGGESLFAGDIISAGDITYEIPALEKGEYFFQCDVHPDGMNGSVVVE